MEDHKIKTSQLFREMVEVKKVPLAPSIHKHCEVFVCLPPASYGHPPGINECVPSCRNCRYCWRYWCGRCGTGLGGMYGSCDYEFCEIGRKNKLKY